MSQGAVLYLVAAAIYLTECLVWVPSGRVALLSHGFGRFRPRTAVQLFGLERGGFALLWPLPPLGRFLQLTERPPRPEDLDARAVAERIRLWRAETANLRLIANLLLVYLFGIAPAVALTRGLAASWLPLLACLLVLDSLVLVEFVLVHRRLLPGARGARLGRVLLMAVSPLACVRADDALGRTVLEPAHPLVACTLLCERAEVERFARRTLWDAGLLADPVPGGLAERLDGVLAAAGLSLVALRQDPAVPEAGAVGFCPRCHVQYVIARTTCSDCGVATRPFSPPS